MCVCVVAYVPFIIPFLTVPTHVLPKKNKDIEKEMNMKRFNIHTYIQNDQITTRCNIS